MTCSRGIGLAILARVACSVCLALSVFGASAKAEELSEQQIFDALTAHPITRGLSTAERPPDLSQVDQNFISDLRAQKIRSLSADDRDRVAAIAKDRPAVDLEVYFDYNSAVLNQRATPQLTALGRALSRSDLHGGTFLIGGHTDAKGSDRYNLALSQQRAEAVKNFLVERFSIPKEDLVAMGYGKQGLKSPGDPFAAENRRVQVATLASQPQARQ
jgi:outer membrane protein OmpA-like peptidoglycan-associated protein